MASVAVTSQPLPIPPMSSSKTSPSCSAESAGASKHPERIISIDPVLHPQIYHAWVKYCKVGTEMTGTNTRALNSSRLRRGIKHALEQISGDVRTPEEQQAFVSKTWGRYRGIQRADLGEEMHLKALSNYERHLSKINYADIGEEPASFEKLCELLQQKGSWWQAVTSENNRIAAEKRRRKERDLINSKFGHLPESERLVAYNHFKAENERLSSMTVKEASDGHKREFLKWLKDNPVFFKLGKCEAYEKAPLKIIHTRFPVSNDKMITMAANASHMLTIVKHLMSKATYGTMKIHISYDANTQFSPRQMCYSSAHGCMNIHNTQRLPAITYAIDAVIDDNVVISSSEGLQELCKRLPMQFYDKFHAYVKVHGLVEWASFRKVYSVKPEFISSITFQTTDKRFVVNKSLRTHNIRPIAAVLNSIDEKWSFNRARHKVITNLEHDLSSKKRSPRPPLKVGGDIVAQLTQLKIMKTDGDISEEEFLAAKTTLFK